MADNRNGAPNWGLVGVGADGAEMASQVVTDATHDVFDDRIALLGRAVADVRAYAEQIGVIGTASLGEAAADTDRIVTFDLPFGMQFDLSGVVPEERQFCANTERVVESLRSVLDGADAIAYLTVPGGKASWVVPALVERIGATANGHPPDAPARGGRPQQFVVATLPSETDPIQTRFDACYTLFGLLGPDERRSAATTFLVSKPTLQEQFLLEPVDSTPGAGSTGLPHGPIATAVNQFIAAGRRSDRSPHGTFGIARDRPLGLDLTVAIEAAADATFVPVDVSTVESVSLIVGAPEERIRSDAITAVGVADAFGSWATERGISDRTRGSTLVSRPGDGQTFDVLFVPTGFDLGPVLDPLEDAYEQGKAVLERAESSRDLARAERLERRVRGDDTND
ncbi:hypothetical protein GCM10008995_15350 [Halobellus salinus]|uniref:Uncharacterized protein n=1 Tax=Halobellus salinus TaxID=931585 RepID=A0A830EMW5_9EURY|nr:hypothetical protein [Halobellus salinus]GGJ06367.1 hypothetical protein GCM10008995_15350 [Halobellus salinus]SMP14605.1 hypothetical protein SAMN06265347_10540 [Halobellus salinus]